MVRSRVLPTAGSTPCGGTATRGVSATVDYLFGYDATAWVVEDWMYERVTEAYVGDPDVRGFFRESNPWALRDRRAPAGSR